MTHRAGIIVIDKGTGISSAGVIKEVKKKLESKLKIGHAGTLDPFASGILICLLGNATRLARFATSGLKGYRGEILLGTSTASDDITGEVIPLSELPIESPRSASEVSDQEISQAALAFSGNISQLPPQVSALKVNGKRAYALVRQGVAVDLAERQVFIESFKCERVRSDLIAFEVYCGAGTYIRAIARDIGLALGSGACLQSLCRFYSAPFSLDHAIVAERVTPESLLPWTDLFKDLPTMQLEALEVQQLKNGLVPLREELAGRARDRFGGSNVILQSESAEGDFALGLLAFTENQSEFLLM